MYACLPAEDNPSPFIIIINNNNNNRQRNTTSFAAKLAGWPAIGTS